MPVTQSCTTIQSRKESGNYGKPGKRKLRTSRKYRARSYRGGNTCYYDGEILEEDYGKTEITSEGIARDPVVLGDNEYFVLGDNREISKDSRIFGAVKKIQVEKL